MYYYNNMIEYGITENQVRRKGLYNTETLKLYNIYSEYYDPSPHNTSTDTSLVLRDILPNRLKIFMFIAYLHGSDLFWLFLPSHNMKYYCNISRVQSVRIWSRPHARTSVNVLFPCDIYILFEREMKSRLSVVELRRTAEKIKPGDAFKN